MVSPEPRPAPDRLRRRPRVGYASLRAENLEELHRGARQAASATRSTPGGRRRETPSDIYYDKKLGAQLGEAFRSGAPVAGFAHVATLPLPEKLHRDPVQVYRLAEEGPG